MSFKFTVELCVMTMKSDTKIQEKLTRRFKIDMNFTSFDPSTRKVERLTSGLKKDMRNLTNFHQST